MNLKDHTKFKTVFYSGDDIREWVNKSISPSNNGGIGGGNAVSTVQQVNLYDKSSNIVGLSLGNATSYDIGSHEYVSYKLTYFFDEGTIDFVISTKDNSSGRRLNPGKYFSKIYGGTGLYINVTGYVVFEVLDDRKNIRKIKFYKK